MEMKKSDLLDRWTILTMKARIDPAAKVEYGQYNEEVSKLLAVAPIKLMDPFLLIVMIVQLMEANAKIWAKESALRNGLSADGRDVAPLAEIGKTALEIRELNKLRVSAKHEIDRLYGELPDVKVDHASQ